jgi:hypothetical protein
MDADSPHARRVLAALLAIAGSPVASSCRRSESSMDVRAEEAPKTKPESSAVAREDAGSAKTVGIKARLAVCEGPKPVLVDGRETGFEVCGPGAMLHRKMVAACPNRAPRPGDVCREGSCRSDGDCPGRHSYCGWTRLIPDYTCKCMTGCETDADCGAHELCACEASERSVVPVAGAPPLGRCVPADCRSDADCHDSPCCATSTSNVRGLQWIAMKFACQSPEDECVDDFDCPPFETQRALCVLTEGVRRCTASGGIAGRALSIGERSRVAMVMRATAWC